LHKRILQSLATSCLLLALAACSSIPVTPPDAATRAQFENAIAEKLLSELHEGLSSNKIIDRSGYLRDRQMHFQQSVDLDVVSSEVKREHALLEQLIAQAENLEGDYSSRVKALSSLDWTLAQHRSRLLKELDRLDQTIAALAAESGISTFDLSGHLQSVRDSAVYPEDSFAGRQAYLDTLSEAMFQAQVKWHDALKRYEPFELAIRGTEEGSDSFRIVDDSLVINLSRVQDLPDFEIASLAIYYGFPGQQALKAAKGPQSLSRFLHLPGYELGWAAYILEQLSIRDVVSTLNHLYFSRLLASLALADLNYHTGRWDRTAALMHLKETTPYHQHRLDLMLNTVILEPGYYLAGLAGKLTFIELHQSCMQQGRDCHSRLNQKIINHAAQPFTAFKELSAQMSSQ
jgi:hypothetical protein